MKHLKKFNENSGYDEYRGTVIGDSIGNIIDSWKHKPFNNFNVEKGKVQINSQEGGNLMDKYKALKLYLKNEFSIDSKIRDIGWKVSSLALTFDANQLVDKLLYESYSGSHEERFNRAIYLHYVDLDVYNDYKRVDKELFFDKLSAILQSKTVIEMDKNNIYRLADTKTKWLNTYKRVIGEVWEEDGLESYWIKVEYL